VGWSSKFDLEVSLKMKAWSRYTDSRFFLLAEKVWVLASCCWSHLFAIPILNSCTNDLTKLAVFGVLLIWDVKTVCKHPPILQTRMNFNKETPWQWYSTCLQANKLISQEIQYETTNLVKLSQLDFTKPPNNSNSASTSQGLVGILDTLRIQVYPKNGITYPDIPIFKGWD